MLSDHESCGMCRFLSAVWDHLWLWASEIMLNSSKSEWRNKLIYSGAKKYLVSHQLCKFSHLKRWERPVIFIIGIPQLWETKKNTFFKNPTMWFSGFFFLILSPIVEVYLSWKLQASLIFLSGRTCTIGGWLNTFFPHCISRMDWGCKNFH